MATFNYTVDTQPMADEMRSVSRHVDVTTGAVVAMQAAVIAEEGRAADRVCNNVNKGFYSLIRSQISQKLAKLQSEVDSQIMQMRQQKNALLSIKNRMEKDYNMISTRYIKLFNGLNANLKNRIFELDKPTIDFACKEIDKVSNRTKYLTATIPVTQLESLSASQKIIASNVKHRGLQVINSMKWFIHEMNVQKDLTDQIMIRNNSLAKMGIAHVPVAIYESNIDRTGNKNIDIVMPDAELNSVSRSAISNKAYAEFSNFDWSQNSSPNQEVISEFSKLISASSSSAKVKDLALRLFQLNSYLTI